ncbi:TetR/AcrR family transcriptional regulator [Streptomyces roseirectus]|uniref:TetR/AcrR family transcriptional regulator n=2 Tax=Streptomyces roseirectus TaxID=2768066 RepID=A0A7H0IQF1_9ACTN|nr:TetR/AcrR family transcriptional regulator [Streptomyces roseirectus]
MDSPDAAKRSGSDRITPRKYDSAGSRAALMSAAARCFGKYGYDGTSIRDIAKAADVDAALVYRYFGSKQGLFEAVAHHASALFEPLRHLPLEDVPDWILRLAFDGPGEDEIPHPVLTMLRSPSREEAVARLRSDVTEIFSEHFARRLDGPDAQVRAELLAAWALGMTLMRLAVQTPALSSVPDSAVLPYVRKAVDPLLRPCDEREETNRACRCGRGGE